MKKRFDWKTWLGLAPCFCFFMIFLMYHLLLGPDRADAVWFADRFKEYGIRRLPEYLCFRWQNWSGRILIEPLYVVFSGISYWIFKIVDFLLWCLLGFSFLRCFVSDNNENVLSDSWLVVLILLLYALKPMNSAGWIATMINNIWPLAAGCFCIMVMLCIRQRRYCSGWKVVSAIMACAFAAGTEQMCVVMLSAVLFLFLDALLRKETWWSFVPFFGVVVLQLLIHILCPGNQARIIAETEKWFPEYSSFGVADRLYIGFAFVMNYYMGSFNPLALIFFFSLGIAVSGRKNGVLFHLIAWIPLVILIWQPMLAEIYPEIGKFIGSLNATALSSGRTNQLSFAVCIVFIMISVVNIFLCTDDSQKGLLLLWVIATGFTTAEMMGFSPTVYASGERTFIFSQFAFAAGTLILVKQSGMEKYRHYLFGLLPVLALLSVGNNLSYIIRG